VKRSKEKFDYEQLEDSIAWGIFKGGFWLFLVVFIFWIFFPFIEEPMRAAAGKIAAYARVKIFTRESLGFIGLGIALAIPSFGVTVLCNLIAPKEYSYLSAWKEALFLIVNFLCFALPIWLGLIVLSDGFSLVPPMLTHIVLWIALYFLHFSEYENIALNKHVDRLDFQEHRWRGIAVIFSFVCFFVFFIFLFAEGISILTFVMFSLSALLFYLGFVFKLRKEESN
jgi:hypothetical protein